MKKIAFCAGSVMLALLIPSCNEEDIPESQVPQAVVTAFHSKYPNTAAEEWEKGKESGKIIYEAKVKVNGKEIESEFDENGTFIKEE